MALDRLTVFDNFNNCKSNLRISNAILNARNVSKRKGTESRYLGVAVAKYAKSAGEGKTYYVRVADKYVGSSPSEEHAARLRDIYIMKTYGKTPDAHRFNLNFTWTDEDIEKWESTLKKNN